MALVIVVFLVAALVGPPAPADPAECVQLRRELEETRRVRRNLLLNSSRVAAGAFADVAATTWAANERNCATTAPGGVCFAEANKLVPTRAGLFAVKGLLLIGGTVVTYEWDKRGHPSRARWLARGLMAAGFIPAGINVWRATHPPEEIR